ncbi:hypothetical protein NPIL_403481, partial [Nephila pilipes]
MTVLSLGCQAAERHQTAAGRARSALGRRGCRGAGGERVPRRTVLQRR